MRTTRRRSCPTARRRWIRSTTFASTSRGHRPGSPLPHAWIDDEDGNRRALRQLVAPGRFLLIAGEEGEAWCTAAPTCPGRALQISTMRIGHVDGDLFDPRCTWLRHRAFGADGALLVRPDRFVAWRSMATSEDATTPSPGHSESSASQVGTALHDHQADLLGVVGIHGVPGEAARRPMREALGLIVPRAGATAASRRSSRASTRTPPGAPPSPWPRRTGGRRRRVEHRTYRPLRPPASPRRSTRDHDQQSRPAVHLQEHGTARARRAPRGSPSDPVQRPSPSPPRPSWRRAARRCGWGRSTRPTSPGPWCRRL